MDSQKSRRERILEARESCNRSLSGAPALYSRERLSSSQPQEEPAVKKGSLIRLFVAALLFLLVFTWDQLKIKAGALDSGIVKQCLSDNSLAEGLEEKAAGFAEETVLPVFQPKSAADE